MLTSNWCRAAIRGVRVRAALSCALLAAMLIPSLAMSRDVTVKVVSPTPTGSPITVGFRWILEEDRTYEAKKGTPLQDTQATNMYRTYMPVAGTGHSDSATAVINVPDDTKRYFLSVLPDQSAPGSTTALDCQQAGNCFTMSGKQVLPGQNSVLVVVTPQPVPTAQVFIRAYEDTAPLNNVWDDAEAGLGGFPVFIYDMAGQMNTDTYGNPLGTVYNGLNADGSPHVQRLGDGTIHTMTAAEVNDPAKNPYGLEVGEALIKNIAPGKYGVRVVPPQGQGWQQTSTIEGTPGQDTWVKANEPRFFAEFGPAGHHAEYGFVKDAAHPTAAGHYPVRNGPGSISGTIRNQRMSRPSDVPASLAFSAGHRLLGCWVGLNNSAGVAVYAGPCDSQANFSISGLQPGTYQLVVFDQYLDLIVNMVNVDVGVGANAGNNTVNLGDVPTFRWFQAHEHWVFNDANENGMRDPGEAGIPDQTINLRYRDGSIYQSSTTDTTGYLPFDEVFPFFSWLIAEVDFARFKATGVTIATDAGGPVKGDETGGEVPSTDRPGNIGHGHLNPQLQNPALTEAGQGTNCTAEGCLTRTETGPALLEGYNAFIGTTNVFEWGKKAYGPGENGGITGVVYYQVTRAENDPRFAAPETWEVGIPRVQVALYRGDSVGNIKDTNGVAGIQLADVDNYPFEWNVQTGTPQMGPEDCHRGADQACLPFTSPNTAFNAGDAIEIVHTDSWDDSLPTDCPGNPADSFHMAPGAATPFNGKCYDGLRNYNQVRPAVFDGGYAFGQPFSDLKLDPGYYVVQASPPPGYQIQKEEDKNVDFGDAMTLSPQALPPVCVGDGHLVPDELALFPGVESKFAGQTRPLCDRRLVVVADGKNAASDFFMFTEVPITGHIQGFVLNDLANEFDPKSPNFGEKFAPSFIPVSVRDYAGNEVYHTTTDAWGTYNAIVPTAYRINTPMPSGVSPNMLQVCLNSPMMEDAANPGKFIPDPNFNKLYTQFCYTLNFVPGQTTFLDTPVLPIAAFASPGSSALDCEYPIKATTANPIRSNPIIHSVVSSDHNGPVLGLNGGTLTITSVGERQVPKPTTLPTDGNNANTEPRDYSFGSSGTVTLNGVALQTTTWTPGTITATVPAGARGGQLVITRTDGPPLSTVDSITVITGMDAARVHEVAVGGSIQSVIDAPTTKPGDVVLVPTGNYLEMVILTKPIQLQGAGAASTIINPVQSPTQKIADWRIKVNYLANCAHTLGLLPSQTNNTASANGPCGFTPGTGLFAGDEGPGVLVAPVAGAFNGAPARIDGFTITGADQSAGVFVNGNAKFLEISNNVISNNQGGSAAGIRIGYPTLLDGNDALVDADNDNVNIHHNHVQQNGGLFEPGAGIGLYTGSQNYRVTNNYVCGNFAQGDGGGIAHYGRSPNGLIADNKILFNQTFDQTAAAGGNGGGILIAGHEPQAGAAVALSDGSGPVRILRNVIQGNNAGSGDGAGIALRFVNGAEVDTVNAQGTADQVRARFDSVQILNNMIVNNVAGLAGGGISIQDALNVAIVNNTIANNDSTATAAAALNAANNSSAPQPAGVVSRANSPALIAAATARGNTVSTAVGTFSNPTLQNDIILGNRSMVWSVNDIFGSTGQIYGLLSNAPVKYSDLAVLGVAGNPTLSPVSSLLTTGNAACANATNRCVSGELADEASYLQAPYRHGETANGTPVTGTGVPGGEFPIQAAAALDEGGNFIDVHYGPLSPSGDYHLVSCTNTPAAAVAPTVRSSPAFVSGGASFTYQIPWPTAAVGDRVIAVVITDGAAFSAPTVVTLGSLAPTRGFTQRGSSVNVQNQIRATVLDYTVSGSAPTGNMTLLLLGSARVQVRFFVVSGFDTTTSIQVATSASGNAGSNTIVYPSVTASWGSAPTLWLQASGFDGGNGHAFGTLPANYTNTSDVQGAPAGSGVGATSGWRQATAASEQPGNATFNGAADQWVAVTIAVKAAPASGGSGNCPVDGGVTPAAGLPVSPDIDGNTRPWGLGYDIGADEVEQGTAGATANVAPEILAPSAAASIVSSFLGVPLSFNAVASDANGQALTYSLCRGNGCTGNTGLPAGMAIDSASGVISWPSPTTGVTNGLGTLDNFRLTVSDGALSSSVTFSVAIAAAPAVAAVNDSYNVNSSGTYTVGAPGVLANDTPANGSKTAVLASNAVQGGSVALNSDGSFSFIPELAFVGSTSFTYNAVNAAGDTSAPATVTLTREVAVIEARARASGNSTTWTLSGVSNTAPRTLAFRRLPNNNNCTSNNNCPLLSGGSITWDGNNWTFTATNNVGWSNGTRVRVFNATNTFSAANTLITAVAVTSRTSATSPLSTAYVQCPADTNGDGLVSTQEQNAHPGVVCRHLGAGDGFIKMADGKELYTFGFNDLTTEPLNLAIDKGILNAQFPAPTLKFKEGDDVYLTLTNVGMLKRPDLFDPHSVHFHGFPNAGAVFDGVPESSISINMGFSLTYYYKIVEPGTFMYHCHVEAAEHMQMGMLGNLYVEPAQNGTPKTYNGRTYTNFVYNDGDGATGYDTDTGTAAGTPLEFPIQIGSMDSVFHDEHIGVQPLPFAEMHDDYPMLNGRGYPDTVAANPLPVVAGGDKESSGVTSATESSQKMNTLITAKTGRRILLRISNLNVTRFYTLSVTGGMQMKVVGTGAHILRGPGGADLSYQTSSVTLGGGESADVLIDTTGIAPGTYLLYSTNLESLSNGAQDLGGMMTEIVITP